MASQSSKRSYPMFDPIPAGVHRHISYHLQAKLLDGFRSVSSTLEKFKEARYTDVTILLAEPSSSDTPLDSHIRDLLGLPLLNLQYESQGNAAIHSFLYPWPQLSEIDFYIFHTENGIVEETDTGVMTDGSFPRYVNVILKVWKSTCDLDNFRTAKIDQGLRAMLGKIISPHGLTYKPDGLYLRIQDVELADKRLSCVKVATNKEDIVQYLGLKKRRIETFRTWEDLMDYAMTCRFYNPAAFRVEVNGRFSGSNDSENESPDRHSLNMIKYFIKIYLPANAGVVGGEDACLSRKQVRCDVKDYFGPDFAQRFERSKTKAVFTVDCARLFSKTRNELPKYVKGTDLTYAVKGLKRVVGLYESKYKDAMLDAPEIKGWADMREAFEQRRYRAFRDEAKKHWIYVGAYQKWLDAKRSAQHYKAYKMRQEAQLQERGKPHAKSG
ncbi:hypothetical protein CLCR_04900 [Cladophialophora carrionii]|uniref:Uncharacterized protein n=1 Tax=Cladophialophora carrionii TaxID=86049 RepID=A0A1C1CLS0_9EURO|nr:hypothetical protein CLCR_04900 [Cladophialophora carrionii]